MKKLFYGRNHIYEIQAMCACVNSPKALLLHTLTVPQDHIPEPVLFSLVSLMNIRMYADDAAIFACAWLAH